MQTLFLDKYVTDSVRFISKSKFIFTWTLIDRMILKVYLHSSQNKNCSS